MKNIKVLPVWLIVFALLAGCEKDKMPVCTIISPQDSLAVGPGDQVTFQVNASDKDGRIVEVRYFINEQGITTTAFPYTFVWDTKNYPLGEHTIKAVAIDDNSNADADERVVSIRLSTPRIRTIPVQNVTVSTAIAGGEVVADGGSAITETGIYWGVDSNLVVSGLKQKIKAPGSAFSTKLLSLTSNQTYYYKAYAVNSMGEALGDLTFFETIGNETGSFTDPRDNRTYEWVRIGDQIWMAQNLAWLPRVFAPNSESRYYKYYYVYAYNGTDTAEAAKTENYNKYGVLYNWEAAITACPNGWHLPEDTEWQQLEVYLGMDPVEATIADWRGTSQGRELKTDYDWFSNGNGNNVSSFSALPGGLKINDIHTFDYQSKYAYFWTSSNYSTTSAWMRGLYYNNPGVYRNSMDKERGLSIRCVKD